MRHLLVLSIVCFFQLFVPPPVAAATANGELEPVQSVRFASTDEQKTAIEGLLLKPIGKGPFSSVVMLHGCSGMISRSGKLKRRPAFWSHWLAKRGHLVLMVDSFTPRGFKAICSLRNRPVQPDRERPQDAYGALTYLLARPDVRPDQIILMGWSNGAMTLLWTLKADAPARPRDLSHDFRAAIAFYPGCTKLSKTNYRTKTPVLLQLGEADDWTPAKPCLRLMATANGNGSTLSADVYPDAYHNFDHPNSRLKVITTRNSVYKSGQKQVHTGSNPEARAKAIANVAAFLGQILGPKKPPGISLP
jgi:dienelactone hydrolase